MKLGRGVDASVGSCGPGRRRAGAGVLHPLPEAVDFGRGWSPHHMRNAMSGIGGIARGWLHDFVGERVGFSPCRGCLRFHSQKFLLQP